MLLLKIVVILIFNDSLLRSHGKRVYATVYRKHFLGWNLDNENQVDLLCYPDIRDVSYCSLHHFLILPTVKIH